MHELQTDGSVQEKLNFDLTELYSDYNINDIAIPKTASGRPFISSILVLFIFIVFRQYHVLIQ